ncbi:TetR/AcrR family transcriptional regulator [Nocardia sp. NPDC057353]|uniref:TetR/AcrR family transcriptional regulator n=1 Tax=Nocardia sp. NPDC057353 TaxID=3346104 RepID=UPI00362D04A8
MTARRRPVQRRARETVDILLEAAAQLFAREGLGTTTNRIAERAGFSIGTLYQYFPDKQALLRGLAHRHVRQAETRLATVTAELRATAPPFEETVRALVTAVVELHSDRPALHDLMHRVAAGRVEELAAVRALEDRLAAEVAFHLARCGRGGDDPAALARTVVHVVDAQVHRVSRDVDQLVALVLRLTG